MKKTCARCQLPKPLTDFCKDRSRPDGRHSYCRECKAKADKARLTNPQRRPALLQKMASRSKAWRAEMRKQHRCHDCGADAGKKARCPNCMVLAAQRVHDDRLKARAECFQRYGGARCACCGEENERFLTLDHVKSDGYIHRRSIGGQNGGVIYIWLRKRGFPDGFQVLCYNCNCGRALNDGICPHKEEQVHPIDRIVSQFPELKI